LADSKLEYFVMEIVLLPQHKELKKGETPKQIEDRIYSDILSRPSKFFLGWNKEKRMYGKKFYRNEIRLDEVVDGYKGMVIELLAARWSGNFYKNRKFCNNLFGHQCEYLPICSSNNISDVMYKIREK
jgi:hypothetical protein